MEDVENLDAVPSRRRGGDIADSEPATRLQIGRFAECTDEHLWDRHRRVGGIREFAEPVARVVIVALGTELATGATPVSELHEARRVRDVLQDFEQRPRLALGSRRCVWTDSAASVVGRRSGTAHCRDQNRRELPHA